MNEYNAQIHTIYFYNGKTWLLKKYDAIIVGAGVCGIYQAYKLSQMNMNFLLLEQGSDLGGTWYWNRYPGCRFDSESETYGYSFSKDY